MMYKPEYLPPNPARLIEGLRDTGYDFNTALADIIDNSVDAHASAIDIHIRMDTDGEIIVTVADNGCGMDREALLRGMTYGAPGHADPQRLGKFGLGLKTASTAFCRKLSVISRPDAEGVCLKATWDLDHVAEKKSWELLLDAPSSFETSLLNKVADNHSGTLVVWETVDRILKTYADPSGGFARRGLKKIVAGFESHAAMIYQRFLDPNDKRARNVEITINGELLRHWSPFFENEPETELVAEDTRTVMLEDGTKTPFTIRAFILPRREQFSSDEIAKNARLTNSMQGIYIYRENRLIHFADWLGMFSKEPHLTLLRVEFSFDHALDEAFQVDIKKSRILLNDDLYNWILTKFIPGPRNAANERYRKIQRKKVSESAQTVHSDSSRSIAAKEEDLLISSIQISNRESNEVEVTNAKGQVMLRLLIDDSEAIHDVNVQAVDSIDDGLLWEPVFSRGHHGVRINTGHPYYHKVYVPNFLSGVTIQGIDSLLWALVEAELGTVNEATRNHFLDLRFEVSRLLRKLVVDFPDPEVD